jgi:hypothetical protein
MPQPLLIVYVYGGCYQDEDEFEKALVATYEPDKAERYIRRRKALDKLHDRRHSALELFDNKYRAENPRPSWDEYIPQMLERVRWPAGLRQQDITPEMRAERERILVHNKRVSDEHSARDKEWDEKFQAARRHFLTVARVPKKKQDHFLGYCHTKRAEEYKYKIKELKVI